MNFLVSEAISDTGTTIQFNPYPLWIIIISLVLIFYFVILRPQQKHSRRHKELINSLSIGDEVLTNGGIVGRIIKITNNNYVVILLNENNEAIINKEFITTLLPKGTMKSL